jgi:hypothetical protein
MRLMAMGAAYCWEAYPIALAFFTLMFAYDVRLL